MEVGLTLGLEIREGTLDLSLVDCGCAIQEISIILDGGESWLYQGYANLLCYHFVCVCVSVFAPSGALTPSNVRNY